MIERAAWMPAISRSVDVGGVPAPAHHARAAPVRDALAQPVLHLHLVLGAQHHDARALLVAAGLHQLAHDREHLRRPSQDHGVPALDHLRAALAQLVEPLVDPGGEHPDQRADHEDAAERHGEHREQERPAPAVAAHGARVERAHERRPGDLQEPRPRARVARRGKREQPDEKRDRGHEQPGDDGQPRDERHRAARDRAVEGVVQPLAERGAGRGGPRVAGHAGRVRA